MLNRRFSTVFLLIFLCSACEADILSIPENGHYTNSPTRIPSDSSTHSDTPFALPVTVTATATQPTLSISVEVPDLFTGEVHGIIKYGMWLDESHIAFAYMPIYSDSSEYENTATGHYQDQNSQISLEWIEYDLSKKTTREILSPFPFDISFWERNSIVLNPDYPELYGYFSPSGTKAIYYVWHGSVFDLDSYTEVFVQNIDEGERTKIFQFDYSNVYVYRIQWSSNEERVYFLSSYEGPGKLHVADLESGITVPISDFTEWDGYTEDIFRLSPDEETIATTSYNNMLIFVSLKDGSITVADNAFSSVPIWTEGGDAVYYWYGSMWFDASELRTYQIGSMDTTILFTESEVAQVLRSMGHDISPSAEDYLLGGLFDISPSGKRIIIPQTTVGPLIIGLMEEPGA